MQIGSLEQRRPILVRGSLSPEQMASGVDRNALDDLALAVVMIDSQGAVRWRNRLALRSRGIARATESGVRLKASRDPVRVAMSDACEAALRDSSGFALSPAVECDGHQYRLFAIRLEGGDAALVLLTPMHEPEKDGIVALLTPTELSMVQRIAEGKNLRTVAAELCISYHTARKYVQIIFQKTSTNRQTELVARYLGSR